MIPRNQFSNFAFESIELDSRGEIAAHSSHEAQRVVVPLPGDVELELVAVGAGEFDMGSEDAEDGRWRAEGPRHRVRIDGFLLGRFPITQRQWRCLASRPPIERDLPAEPSRFSGENRPVENIDWHDASELCRRLSALLGWTVRLPSEAEWEYACRAGSTTRFHCGETLSPLAANYACESAGATRGSHAAPGETTPVDRFPANRFGLHDMHGNVFEWCADVWHADYGGAPSTDAAWLDDGESKYRPLRGGAWCTRAQGCRSAYRSAAHESRDHRINTYSMRVAASLTGR